MKRRKAFFSCIFRYKLFNIDVLNNITVDVESEGKFENHYRLCSCYRSAFNQAPLSRQLTGRSMQLKAIVTSVCVCARARATATVRLGINVPALEQTDPPPNSQDFNNNFIVLKIHFFIHTLVIDA